MRLNFLVTTMALLVAFPPPYECRAIDSSSNQPVTDPDEERQSPAVLARMGEEYFIRLGNRNKNSPRSPPDTYPEASQYSKRALQLQLTQRVLEGKVGNVGRWDGNYALRALDSEERERRSEEPPISLDLTFHLLREVLEMARAEQLVQQAHSNRKMMEIFGK
uniref:Corticoliberin-2 n=1 Tax=Catostomus commersonii TaxID=7971 RepID=CRF2_CATCO|nr:RecName: Full=Corticoliberin-2; AltName: Full=Corticotropin-releasing factor 2; Short=CRF 2; AltName: Full=Corticotropin-releasing hormone 2; Flags: Precursor [Catostomus commersonii]CAA41589.1 corticotropin-releasing factor precursor 2 [Catostomus commersonii]